MAVIGLKSICNPAMVYLVLSLLALFIMAVQNYRGDSIYCLGSYSCNVSSVTLIFIVKFIYIIFWTWLLNIICKSGFPIVSWILVLLPFVLLFILISLLFVIELDAPSMNNLTQMGNNNSMPFLSSYYNWLAY
jgi:hypothetical protein